MSTLTLVYFALNSVLCDALLDRVKNCCHMYRSHEGRKGLRGGGNKSPAIQLLAAS